MDHSLIEEYGFWILSLLGVLNLIAILFVWRRGKRSAQTLDAAVHTVFLNVRQILDNWPKFGAEYTKSANKGFPSAASEEGTNHCVSRVSASCNSMPTLEQQYLTGLCMESFEKLASVPSEAPGAFTAEIKVSFAPGDTSIDKRHCPAGK